MPSPTLSPSDVVSTLSAEQEKAVESEPPTIVPDTVPGWAEPELDTEVEQPTEEDVDRLIEVATGVKREPGLDDTQEQESQDELASERA